MSQWSEAGQPLSDFWTQTPRLFGLVMRGRLAAARTDDKNRAWLAWHTAAMPLMKDFPSLADLTGERPQIKKMTPAEMKAVWASMREAA